jgi:pimeloyl-ACP methyl ester carboxylesterase
MSAAASVLIVVLIGFLSLALGTIIFTKIAERRNPPIGKFIECEGVRLHYIERGNSAKPAVVLFHGNGSMIQDFALSGLIDALAVDHRVLCFDRPGFGHSSRPRSRVWTPETQAGLFASALERLRINNPVLVGHSWGTLVALAMALYSTCRVRALVLTSGYYFPTWRPDFWILATPSFPVFGDFLRYTFAPIIALALLPSLVRSLFAPRPVSPKFKKEFPFSLTLRPKQLRAAAEESAYLIPTAAQFQWIYGRLDCPVKVIHGGNDKVIEREQAERLHQALRRSEIQILHDAGHMAHYVHPQAIVKAVLEMERS